MMDTGDQMALTIPLIGLKEKDWPFEPLNGHSDFIDYGEKSVEKMRKKSLSFKGAFVPQLITCGIGLSHRSVASHVR
jgi:hypothetical protein